MQNITNEPNKTPHILVACPTHEVKEYAFQRWIDNVKNLTYPNYTILVADNSPPREGIPLFL